MSPSWYFPETNWHLTETICHLSDTISHPPDTFLTPFETFQTPFCYHITPFWHHLTPSKHHLTPFWHHLTPFCHHITPFGPLLDTMSHLSEKILLTSFYALLTTSWLHLAPSKIIWHPTNTFLPRIRHHLIPSGHHLTLVPFLYCICLCYWPEANTLSLKFYQRGVPQSDKGRITWPHHDPPPSWYHWSPYRNLPDSFLTPSDTSFTPYD